jgi:hypothetical protein
MKQILDKTQQIHYVDSSNMITFISENSEMKHNQVCDFVRERDICDGEDGLSFWEKADLIKTPEEFNEDQLYWVGAFFEAHPWIERMVIVFSD